MVHTSILQGCLLVGMISRVMLLCLKQEIKLTYPIGGLIALLNVFYKIVAKSLQIRLQHPLKDVISPKHLAFLSYRHILGNILL